MMERGEPNLKIVVIGDSWVSPRKLVNIVKSGQINISPHINSIQSTKLNVMNLSEGSLSMSKVVKDVVLLDKWVENRPVVTVLHAFACDLINKKFELNPPKGTSVATFYKNWMLKSL